MTGTVALVAGTHWSDTPAARRRVAAVAANLYRLDWCDHTLLYRDRTPTEAAFYRCWVFAGGTAEVVDDPAGKVGQVDGPDLLIVFVATTGDDAHKASDAATIAGWPPILTHSLPGAYPYPPGYYRYRPKQEGSK